MAFLGANQIAPISIAASGSGATQIVAAPTDGRRIVVTGVHLQADATVSIKWQSHNTDLTGPVPQVAGGGYVLSVINSGPFGKDYWLECAANEELNLYVSGAVNLGGHVLYRVVGN